MVFLFLFILLITEIKFFLSKFIKEPNSFFLRISHGRFLFKIRYKFAFKASKITKPKFSEIDGKTNT